MNAHIKSHTIIYNEGEPAFVVVPYREYIELTESRDDDNVEIPHEVVELMTRHNCNLLGGWRRYRKLTQGQLGKLMDVSQSAIAQMERADNPRSQTLEKAAAALECDLEQLTD